MIRFGTKTEWKGFEGWNLHNIKRKSVWTGILRLFREYFPNFLFWFFPNNDKGFSTNKFKNPFATLNMQILHGMIEQKIWEKIFPFPLQFNRNIHIN